MHHLVGGADEAQAVERGAKALRVSLSVRGGLLHLWSMLLLLYKCIVLDRCSTSLSSPTSSNVTSPMLRLLAASSTLAVPTLLERAGRWWKRGWSGRLLHPLALQPALPTALGPYQG